MRNLLAVVLYTAALTGAAAGATNSHATRSPASARRQAWLAEQVRGDLAVMLRELGGLGPGEVHGRDVPNGALAALVLAAPATVDGQVPMQPSSAACRTAADLLVRAGGAEGMSFGGQSTPSLLHSYASCFNATTAAWLAAMVNASLPASQAAATPQEVSYTNMWLMSTVDSILWGELPGTGENSHGPPSHSAKYQVLQICNISYSF
jgi:hypothetical protein